MAKKAAVFAAALLILLSGTFGIWSCYEKAELIASDEAASSVRYFVADEFENNTSLRTLPYALKAEVQSEADAFDVLMEVECEDAVILQRIKGVFGTYYGYWKSHIYEYPNIHTYVKDLNSGAVSGTHTELKSLSKQELEDSYQIVLKLSYDSQGTLTLEAQDLVGFPWEMQFDEAMKAEIENYMSAEVREYAGGLSYSEELFKLTLSPITDMEMIIAVPYELVAGDALYSAGQMRMGYRFQQYLAVYALLICALVFVLSLFLPLSIYKETHWTRRLLNIKFEILAVLLGLGIGLGFYGALVIGSFTVDGTLYELICALHFENFLNELTLMINGVLWFVCLALVMLTAMLIRWIWNKGIFTYIKQNTCAAWVIGMIAALIHWIMSLFERLLSFDLKDSTNQLVIKITGVNLLVIVLLCCMFPVGIFLAVLYSAALFFFLRKKLRAIQKDYESVLECTKTLSSGNFNVSIDQNAGIFSSLKEALGTLKIGFQQAVNEEVKSQRMKSELITNVSHDLKTPLTSIITYVDLLKKSESEEEKQQYIETIDKASHRLKHLIEDLFEVSKANSGNVALNLVEADLVSLLHQVQFECEEKIAEKNLEFRMIVPSEKIMLQLDSAKAYRIFENLILNICKYALSGTRVFVNVECLASSVKITFKNISEQELTFDAEEITERFVQGDKSRNAQGSGLGLAIVKSFTELHHGTFHVECDGDLFKAIVEFPMN